ncbi:MAG: KilA-N domain-containing protein [Moraxella sp.]|nr:KilA-N domain-containing protein [Moraxella sp.]
MKCDITVPQVAPQSNLTIGEAIIAVVDGLYSLNDLHKASGGETKHQPSNFMRNDETKALIAVIERSSDLMNGSIYKAYKRIKGGLNQGTYVCKELVYRYAMWISAKFSLMVIRAFDMMTGGANITALATKDERKPLVQAVNMLVAETGAIYSNVWKMIHQRFDVSCVDELTGEQVHQAVEYVHGLMLKVKENPDNAFWRMVGVLEYDRISHELRNLQSTLDTAQRQLNRITKTKGLLYDAFGEQRHVSHDPNLVANAQAFIDRQMAMKTRFL